jgi:hypothetical protein
VGPKIYPFGRVLEAEFSFTGLYIFAKFRLEKYDFDPYKGGFFMGKMAQIRSISNFKNSKLPESYDNFQKVSQEYRRILLFFYKNLHIYYVAKSG